MVLKLHGFIHSTSTQRVMLVLKELNVPYEFVVVDMTKAEHKSAEYMAKHPYGVVPFMDDDGFQLYESRAICRYIVAKYGQSDASLVPSELNAHALFEQAASIEASYFEPPAVTILHEKVLAKYYGKEPDEDKYEKALKKLGSSLDIYETTLSKQKYVAGDNITLADLFHIPLGNIVYMVSPDTLLKRPNVARWWKDLSSRPSSQAVVSAIREARLDL